MIPVPESHSGLRKQTPQRNTHNWRRFRDWTGRAHQRLAAISDEVYLGVIGSILRLRPEPLCLRTLEDP